MSPPPLPAVPTPAAAPPAPASFPAMLHSVEALASFSDLLADFLDQWNSLLVDANSIVAAFAPLAGPLPEPDPNPIPVAKPASNPVAVPEDLLRRWNSLLVDAATTGSPVADPVQEIVPLAEPEPTRQPEPERKPEPAPDRELRAGDPLAEVLGKICEQMGSRALRRFATAHLRDRSWLRRVGPGALRRAPDPAALVLYAISRFYIHAESENAEAACVLLLELYVRAGCPHRPDHGQGDAELRAEAREAVLSWRSRIVRDKGRVADASARDARGLILLMAAFGVPAEFPVQELRELLFAGGGLACSEVLKCSQLFVKKLRDVVADMLNKGSYHEAIGIILVFELQDAFPLAAILTYIIEKVVHNRKDQQSEGQCNLAGSKEHDEEELVILRSISKYVEENTPCSSKMACLSMAERIKLLEDRVGKPKQAFEATKQKRTTEDSLH